MRAEQLFSHSVYQSGPERLDAASLVCALAHDGWYVSPNALFTVLTNLIVQA